MTQSVQLSLIILILLEIFELYWQKGSNFREYLGNLYSVFSKGVILFILLHPALYFVIFSQISMQNYSVLASSIIFLKVLDIGFKLKLMDKIHKGKDLGSYKELIDNDYPLSIWIKSVGIIIYPTMFFFAFS